MAESTEVRTEKGISLARGPALILGTILLTAGLYFLYKQHFFPKLTNFPGGHAPVQGKVFLGIFGANGWTGMLTAVGGGLLLFGAAEHLLAKTMSLIVGIALGAAAIIALARGNVLGLAAANHWTELGWGVVAAILLFNTVIPRRRRAIETGAGADAHDDQATQVREPVTQGREPVTQVREPDTQVRGEDTQGHEPDPEIHEQDTQVRGEEPDAVGSEAAVRHEPEG